MENIGEINDFFGELKDLSPKELSAFIGFSGEVKKEKVLEAKHKNLMLLAIAVYAQCKECIIVHFDSCIKSGATKEEILESTWLAVVMGGGPKLMYMHVVLEEIKKHFG